MRNIATCYSEHAVRVSDSYCSGPLTRAAATYVTPKSSISSSIQNAVAQTYKVKLSAEKRLFVTITWCTKLICQGFFLRISNTNTSNNNSGSHHHQFAKLKGTKSLDSQNDIVVHWDLSAARFEAGPVPLESYYVVVLIGTYTCIVIGDMGDNPVVKELVGRSSSPSPSPGVDIKTSMVSQYEHFTGSFLNSQITTRARFSASGSDHEIMIKCGPDEPDGPRSPPGLSVFVDRKRVVRVKTLQWNFRGNQVIFVDGLLVDVMWDVYGWYFDHNHQHHQQQMVNSSSKNNKNGGCGMFMFRTRSGLDSRLWLEEEERKLADKFPDKPDFTLLICASGKNPG